MRCDSPESGANVAAPVLEGDPCSVTTTPSGRYVWRSLLPFSAETVFRWHEQPGALERMIPPWEPVLSVQKTGGIANGDQVTLRFRLGPVPLSWWVEHQGFVSGVQFQDVQRRGPFKHWRHTHHLQPQPNHPPQASECWLTEAIDYALPLEPLSTWVADALVQRKLNRMFRYRHRVLQQDLTLHQRYQHMGSMRVAVSGSHGLIGQALCALLQSGGHAVTRLQRVGGSACTKTRTKEETASPHIHWNPAQGLIDQDALEGLTAVVHLAGEPILAKPWTPAQQQTLLNSRIHSTQLLAETLSRLKQPPKTLIVASAVGYYGTGYPQPATEETPAGSGFLAEMAQAWEAASQAAQAAGIRVIHLRLGAVLSPKGGMLKQLLPIFALGGGGPLSNGLHRTSWISLDDAIGAIYHALATESLAGPVNVVAPQILTNADWSRTLGRVLRRPAVLPAPRFALEAVFGKTRCQELLLADQPASPQKLIDSGYSFQFPQLEEALKHLLGIEDTLDAWMP